MVDYSTVYESSDYAPDYVLPAGGHLESDLAYLENAVLLEAIDATGVVCPENNLPVSSGLQQKSVSPPRVVLSEEFSSLG